MADMNFARTVMTHDKATDRVVPTVSTIPGKGVRLPPNVKLFESLKLRVHEAASVKWAPLVYGQTPDPEPGDETFFESRKWKVREVLPLNPSGPLIVATIVLVGT